MIKKVTYSLLVLVSVLTLSGCGNSNQSKNNDANSTSQQDESSKSITPTKENAIIGCYRDDKDGAAINIYGDGTGRYVLMVTPMILLSGRKKGSMVTDICNIN